MEPIDRIELPSVTYKDTAKPLSYTGISILFGGARGDRTPDLCLAKAALSLLS
tara:strand:+ start:240 stop:398 length:159 start_codon:yes stop_codon:yes gene_type:complete